MTSNYCSFETKLFGKVFLYTINKSFPNIAVVTANCLISELGMVSGSVNFKCQLYTNRRRTVVYSRGRAATRCVLCYCCWAANTFLSYHYLDGEATDEGLHQQGGVLASRPTAKHSWGCHARLFQATRLRLAKMMTGWRTKCNSIERKFRFVLPSVDAPKMFLPDGQMLFNGRDARNDALIAIDGLCISPRR